MNFDSPDAFLAHVLWTFRPYLDRLVLVGGFAVRLYELHPRASQATIRVLRTFDADFATANDRIPVVGESLTGLAEAAGFRRDFRGDHAPPVIKLVPKEAPAGPSGVDQYTIEFLSPPSPGRQPAAAGEWLRRATFRKASQLNDYVISTCSSKCRGQSPSQGSRESPRNIKQFPSASPIPASSLFKRS